MTQNLEFCQKQQMRIREYFVADLDESLPSNGIFTGAKTFAKMTLGRAILSRMTFWRVTHNRMNCCNIMSCSVFLYCSAVCHFVSHNAQNA
jgi:hypothetical protein